MLLSKKYVFWFFSTVYPETFLILRRNERHVIKIYISLHVKYPLFLFDFNETWIFLTDFEKISNIKFHENPSGGGGGGCSMRTDRRTDMTKLIVSLRYNANAPKMADLKFRPCTLKAGFIFMHLFIRVVLKNMINMSDCVASRLRETN